MQLHLVDGTYDLFRAHFGSPNRTAPDAREVGATIGLVEMTLSLLREPGVTHVAVAMDSVIRSFRNDLFPGYKTEEGMPPELLAQFPLAERALRAAGVVVWGMVEYEADDAIATAAARWGDEVERVVMLTPDKDLGQCVRGERVVQFDRRKREVIDEAAVRAKFGVAPESIPDYLALVGDAADKVPGLPGWGAKAAAAVLSVYPHIEEIPPFEHRWASPPRGAVRLAATLRERMADALLYRQLTTLRRDVPLAETLDDLEWRGAHREPFLHLCDELGADGLRTRPHRWADD
ncbi:MAG: 5'-3' exonuclease [Tepidiformaceae bacterium]